MIVFALFPLFLLHDCLESALETKIDDARIAKIHNQKYTCGVRFDIIESAVGISLVLWLLSNKSFNASSAAKICCPLNR